MVAPPPDTLTLQDELHALATCIPADALEATMLEHEQVECPVVHHFGPGVYIREVRIPAGTLAMGHHQRFHHTNIILKGKVLIVGPNGPEVLQAPMMYVGKPGRKLGIVLEDLVWHNVYATDVRDVDKLEELLFDKSEGFMLAYAQLAELQNQAHAADREDYAAVIAAAGFTEAQVREQTENEGDRIPMPEGWVQFTLKPSAIQGMGTFIDSGVSAGTVIGPARIGDKRTPLGRWVNHSTSPNAKMERVGDDIFLVATRDISGARGGLPGDEVTICYRQALSLSGIYV